MTAHITRRQFLATSAVLAGGPMILSSPARGFAAASERIRLGFIGIGIQSRGHLRRFATTADVQVLAVCDVVTERREDSKRIVEEAYAKLARRLKSYWWRSTRGNGARPRS